MTSPVFGSYIAGDGPMQRLAAGPKLLWLLAVTVVAFAHGSLAVACALLAGAVACARLSGVGWSSLVRAAAPAAVVLVLALVGNALVADGTGDAALLGPLGVSFSGLERGVAAVLRILALVAWSLVYTATTRVQATADALSRMLSPLGRLGCPVDSWAMVLSLALRFVPLCGEELVRVRDAQRARGVMFDEGGPVARLGRWRLALAPLVVALFRKADESARAMSDRCWGIGPRTSGARPFTAADVACAVAAAVLLCLCWVL
ncbi:energy-coupling factor transporter transmembrane component T [Atopobiaceae bacterium 24-176]